MQNTSYVQVSACNSTASRAKVPDRTAVCVPCLPATTPHLVSAAKTAIYTLIQTCA